MLRVVHTSDWHLGQELAGWSRRGEHQAFFDQLEELLVEREVDALIVAGDVFDHQNPSSQAVVNGSNHALEGALSGAGVGAAPADPERSPQTITTLFASSMTYRASLLGEMAAVSGLGFHKFQNGPVNCAQASNGS
jgi:hypothetical protein